MSEELTHILIMIEKKNHPSIYKRGINFEIFNINTNIVGDYRKELKEYLEGPIRTPHQTIFQAQNFILLDSELYRKGLDRLLLICLSFLDSMEVMKQVHEGTCGAHQSRVKMRWLIRRYGYYWLTILKDSIPYSIRCQ